MTVSDVYQLGEELTSATLVKAAATPRPKVQISESAWARVALFRQTIEQLLGSERQVYGINTGFGFLSDVSIPAHKLEELQVNLIRSHACGVGDPIPANYVRGMLLLRAHTFLKGHSGIREATLQSLLAFLEHDILPIVPSKGSVGASGDLAPLAHLALGLMGEGEVFYNGQTVPAAEALSSAGLEPLRPEAKEGLSLINGTHYMTVLAAHAVEQAYEVVRAADVIAALAIDAIRGTDRAFDSRIQEARGYRGQKISAANVRSMFTGKDEIKESHADCGRVQDPYSFRCVPQVHGASRDVIGFCAQTVNTELNATTDNPLVFEDGDIVSGGNFHGQPIAMAMDFLAIAISELGSISERRVEKITNPNLSGGLPPFAIQDSGLNSGYMIPHVVAASLASENKVLTHPASVDSIPTSADKEDHVSMGPIAARKALEVIENVRSILAIELLAASQGLDLHKPLTPSPAIASVLTGVRKRAPFISQDRALYQEIKSVADWIGSHGVSDAVAQAGITLG